MLKIHKEIYDRKEKMDENDYKFIINISSVSYDVGMGIGFFVVNWLEYSMYLQWQYIVILSVSLMLVTSAFLLFGMRAYLEENNCQETTLFDNVEQSESLSNKN